MSCLQWFCCPQLQRWIGEEQGGHCHSVHREAAPGPPDPTENPRWADLPSLGTIPVPDTPFPMFSMGAPRFSPAH